MSTWFFPRNNETSGNGTFCVVGLFDTARIISKYNLPFMDFFDLESKSVADGVREYGLGVGKAGVILGVKDNALNYIIYRGAKCNKENPDDVSKIFEIVEIECDCVMQSEHEIDYQ
jgi:hypothetical protein